MGDIPFRPISFPLSDYVAVPAVPGTTGWSNAFFGLTAAPQNTDPSFADTTSAVIAGAQDPFKDLVWQMAVSVSPSVNVASGNLSTADDIFEAAKLVALYRTELDRQMAARAISVRQLAEKLGRDGTSSFVNWRGGHFGVPEPAVVESASAKATVGSGDTIAILRPLYRLKLGVTLDPGSRLSRLLMPGVQANFRLACTGPAAVPTAQLLAILARVDRLTIQHWLTSLRDYYLQKTVFNGTVDSEDADPEDAEVRGIDKIHAYLRFEIASRDRAVPFSAASVGADEVSARATLTSLGFNFRDQGDTVMLVPPGGAISPGDKCKATFVDGWGAASEAAAQEQWNSLAQHH